MPLFYKARQSSLKSKDGKKKWFPVLVKTGRPVSLLEMATEVAEKSSLTPGDTLSVSQNLMAVMSRHLMNSRSVRLDNVGTFTVIGKANGTGVDTEEEVSSLQFNGLRVRFTPEYTRNSTQGTTRAMFSKVEYVKWGDSKSTKNNGSESNNDDDDDVINPGT